MYSLHPHEPLIPASNMKLLTTAAALKYLGPDYKFKTVFIVTGKIENSTLHGDIIVRGTGDPTLVSGDWADEWSHKVAYLYDTEHLLDDAVKPLEKLGIKRIDGNIVIDDYYLDHQWVNPTWEKEDLSHWYAAQIGALGINRNIELLELYPQPSGKVKIKVVPDVGYINVTFAGRVVKSSSDVKQWAVEVREPGTNNVKIVGDLPMDIDVYYLSVTVNDPGMYFGAVFKKVLEDHGIKVMGEVKRANTTGWKNQTITTIVLHSKPLKDIIRLMLKKSLNLYADHLFKVLGKVVVGEGSWKGGSKAVEKMLRDLGIMEKEVRIVDGSGLSRENRVTPSLLVNLLRIYADNKVLYNSLPIAGWDGTLKHRMLDTPAEGNLRAKTGTLTGVSALSGYVKTRDNVTLVFSILFNGFHTTAHKVKYEIEDYIGALLADINTSKYKVP